MDKRTGTAITGACIGMAIGTAAYMMTGSKTAKAKTKKIKKSTGRALRQVGDFIDSVSYMMK